MTDAETTTILNVPLRIGDLLTDRFQVKAFIGDRAALRAEYRSSRYSVGGGEDPSESRTDVQTTVHRLFMGVSVWCR